MMAEHCSPCLLQLGGHLLELWSGRADSPGLALAVRKDKQYCSGALESRNRLLELHVLLRASHVGQMSCYFHGLILNDNHASCR